jgi:formate dehydrogenase iron-sulfur subunit
MASVAGEAPLNVLTGGGDPASGSGYEEPPPRLGFFTDTSICIGCKACEVACKEWNGIPEDGLEWAGRSHDNSGGLGADTWRHVAFVEQRAPVALRESNFERSEDGFRWLMSSDVCKHCTHAACLDVCPTGAIFRTEFGTVVIQQDVCNGCGYCVPACPFGVISRRERDQLPTASNGEIAGLGTTHKCTLCYDRLKGGFEPACAKSCPTNSIQFGKLAELQERARYRVAALREQGVDRAYLYGVPDSPGATGGIGALNAFFLLLDRPETYNLPAAPTLPSRRVAPGLAAGLATMAGFSLAAFALFARVKS